MYFDINSNSYFQDNQVLTQNIYIYIYIYQTQIVREKNMLLVMGNKKIQHQYIWTQNRVLKITMIHHLKKSCKKELKKKMKRERERENVRE